MTCQVRIPLLISALMGSTAAFAGSTVTKAPVEPPAIAAPEVPKPAAPVTVIPAPVSVIPAPVTPVVQQAPVFKIPVHEKNRRDYLGLGVGLAHSNTHAGAMAGGCATSRNNGGYQFMAGHYLNRHIALEAAYVDLGESSEAGCRAEAAIVPPPQDHCACREPEDAKSAHGSRTQALTAHVRGFSTSVIAMMPIAKTHLSAYAKGGFYFWNASVTGGPAYGSSDGTSPVFGGGLQYRVNERSSIRLAYDSYRRLEQTSPSSHATINMTSLNYVRSF